MATTISAASLAAAKPKIVNGSYSGGTNLPGAFGQHYAPPTPAPASSGGTTSRAATAAPTGNTGGSTPAYVDPYAQWGGQANYNQLNSDLQNAKNNTYGSINDRIDSEGAGYNSGILDLIDSIGSGQRKIDSQAVNNELAKRQGTAGVLDMVGNGVKNAGVLLSNRNAGTSSATEAFARGYSDLGRKELSGVGNKYELGKNAVAESQADLELQINQGSRHLQENKVKISNAIVSDAQNALSALNAQAAGASLPDRVNIEAEKQRIRQQAIDKLTSFDAQLTEAASKAKTIDPNEARARAAQLATAGTAAEDVFKFSPNTPAQFNGTGPFASDLPLFTPPKKTQLA